MEFIIFKKLGFRVSDLLIKRTKEERYFEEKFLNFFKIEDYLFCYKMIDEGFKPTNTQMYNLEEKIIDKILKNTYKYKDIKTIKIINDELRMESLLNEIEKKEFSYYYGGESSELFYRALSKKDKVQQEDFILNELEGNKKMLVDYTNDFLKLLKPYYSSGLDSHKDFCKLPEDEVEKVKIKLEKIIFLNLVLIKNNLLLPDEVQNLTKKLSSISQYIEKNTSEEYTSGSYYRIGKKTMESFIKALETFSVKNDIDNKDELIRQLKSYTARNKTLSDEIKDLIFKEDYSIENLPIKAKEQVKRLEQLAISFNSQEVKDFLHERLPVVLKKYFSIDEEYRTTLKNLEGFNAQELMLQSLDNIEKILLAKKEDNNIDLLSELSIENRKIKMKVV